MEFGEIWGLTTLGFFQSEKEIKNHAGQTQVAAYPATEPIKPGDLKFKDINQDGVIDNGAWTLKTMVIIR